MLKKLLSALTVGIFALSIAITPHGAIAEWSGKAVEFELIVPAIAKTGEAIDVTVRALDKDKKVATDYRGSIIFVTDYIGDTYPMPWRPIAFTAEDQGEKKFSKGVIFKRTGKQKIFVSDVNDSIVGEVTVTVEEGVGSSSTQEGEITFITPENNARITGNSLMVSGNTRKNSRVSLTLNGTDLWTVVSDESGIFTKEITNITQENNVLVASLIDGSNSVIATSPQINFSRAESNSSVYGVTIAPSDTVPVSSDVTITVEAVAGLSEVNISLDGALIPAKEWPTGKYVVTTKAPARVGTHDIAVTTRSLSQTETKDGMAKLTTTEATTSEAPTPVFKNVRTETHENRVTFSFSIEPEATDLHRFKIVYGTGASALDNEILTHEAKSILKDGVYTWYVATLDPGAYIFKLYGQNTEWALIPSLVSEPINATIGTASCTIGNVGKIHVQTDSSKSVLSWDPVPGANGYMIYQVDADGKYTPFQKVTEASYTLFLSAGAVKYDSFAVKALCGDGVESVDYSHASRVQTGPVMVTVLIIIAGFLAALIMRRRTL